MSNIAIVARREYRETVRKKSFLIWTVLTPVLFGALNTIPRAYNPGGRRTLDQIIDTALDLTLRSWTPR